LWGVVITAVLIGVMELLDHALFPVPLPVVITGLGVAYTAFVGGTWSGMASAAPLVAYAAYRFSVPGAPFHYTARGLSQLGVAAAALPLMVLMIGSLKRRSDRVIDALRAHAALEAQIDERSRVGRALKRERNEQETIFHSVPAMIWFKDVDSRILRANRLAAQSIGRTVEEVEGKSTLELYPDEAGKYQQDDLDVIRSGKPKLGIIERYEIPSGEERWVRTDKIPYYDSSGKIVGVIVFAVDITEQKKAQVALQHAHDKLEGRVQDRTAELVRVNQDLSREIGERKLAEEQRRISEERLQQILDCTTAVIYVKDTESRYQLINRRFEELFHISRQEIPGKTDYDMFPKETADAFRVNDRQVLASGGAVEFEERVPHDEEMHTYISLKFPLFDPAGRPTAVCGISTDITERKKTEALLRDHTAALEAANQALAAAREAAEAANRTKGRFLANISHEIRTPIMAMLGAAELLQSDESGRTVRNDSYAPTLKGVGATADRGDMILRNGRHLLSLVDELLDLSRLEAGKLEIRPSDCSLVEILADVEAITEPLRRQKMIEYRIIYETQVPERIHTDCTRLTQAVINLVSNALKFTEKGYVRMRVRVESAAGGPEPRLTIAVEDSGIGIRPEDRERIFDSFTQVEPISSGATAGVGLGLPIAKWIAEKLGGTLEVQSVFGKGSTFTLHIATGPLDGVPWINPGELIAPTLKGVDPPSSVGSYDGAVHEGSVRPGAPFPKASRKAPCRLQGRVLLAEDAGDIRELIQFVLRRCGVEVTTVENGRQAVEAATREAFDLILMDIRMPELDGLSAAVELRRRGYRAMIIALTASTSDSQREQILASGFDDFWAKPISLDDLAQRLAKYLPSRDGSKEDQVAASGPQGKPSLKGSRAFELPGATTGERMAAIVAEFAASLPVRSGAIRAALESGDLPRARDLLHQLVGTSGIHGFMSISHEAARLLQILKDPTIAIGPAELRSLEDMIAGLRPYPDHNVDAPAAQPKDS
jgi:PAS domain S-box-containing protein